MKTCLQLTNVWTRYRMQAPTIPPPQQVNMKSTQGTKLCVPCCKRPPLSYNLISVVKTILIMLLN